MTEMKITRQSLLDGTIRAYQREHASQHADMRWRTDAEMAELLEAILAEHDPAQDLWVFGYGSLIWNPAFEFVEKRVGLVHGFHRRFCLWTQLGRGSPAAPGLMLAL